GALLLASMVWFSGRGDGVSLHELLITLFLVITTPVSALFIAKAGRRADHTAGTHPPPPPRP
ncbi:MAG: monovalent cation/H(+) antiporter subunit G, partial [Betaproteobacteria bacterium]